MVQEVHVLDSFSWSPWRTLLGKCVRMHGSAWVSGLSVPRLYIVCVLGGFGGGGEDSGRGRWAHMSYQFFQ